MPEVPTLGALGLPGFVGGGWAGFLGPPNLPPPVAAKLEADVRAAMQGGIAEQLTQRGFDPVGSNSEAFRRFIAEETTR